MAKRRPNPLKPPKAKRPKLKNPFGAKLKNPFGDTAFFGPADVLFGMLGALFGARPFPQTTLFQQYLCSKCGGRYQTNAQGPVRFCPQGCGETMEPLGQAGRAMPPRPRARTMSREEAANFIARQSGAIYTGSGLLAMPETVAFAYRAAARRLHPDNKETGNHELFVKLQEAMEVLEG